MVNTCKYIAQDTTHVLVSIQTTPLSLLNSQGIWGPFIPLVLSPHYPLLYLTHPTLLSSELHINSLGVVWHAQGNPFSIQKYLHLDWEIMHNAHKVRLSLLATFNMHHVQSQQDITTLDLNSHSFSEDINIMCKKTEFETSPSCY